MNFESYVIYSYSHLPPFRTHSIWGEFKPIELPKGLDARLHDPQVAAMSKTLDGARLEFPSAILFIDGDPQTTLPGGPCVRFESRYRLTEHNGRMWESSPAPVQFFEIHAGPPLAYEAFLAATSSAALILSSRAVALEELKKQFDQAGGLEQLRKGLFSVVSAYFGFDHDAFFTFETWDVNLIRDALRSAEPSDR